MPHGFNRCIVGAVTGPDEKLERTTKKTAPVRGWRNETGPPPLPGNQRWLKRREREKKRAGLAEEMQVRPWRFLVSVRGVGVGGGLFGLIARLGRKAAAMCPRRGGQGENPGPSGPGMQ